MLVKIIHQKCLYVLTKDKGIYDSITFVSLTVFVISNTCTMTDVVSMIRGATWHLFAILYTDTLIYVGFV